VLFRLSTPALWALVIVVIGGATAAGIFAGRRLGDRRESLREPAGAVQATLLGFVGLLLALGLTMAVGRYDGRRAAVVDEANAIGTTFLRAQTLDEPERTASLDLLVTYTDTRIALSDAVPDSARYDGSAAEGEAIHRDLWRLAGDAVGSDPEGTAPRLYIESLNELIDMHTTRLAASDNRIPAPVLWLQLGGAAVALGALALYLSTLGRGVGTVVLASVMVVVMVLVICDLDRPHRGLIHVPDGPLRSLRASMDEAPAASPG
jgi:hypothetical protein